jgi:hypothetical protein
MWQIRTENFSGQFNPVSGLSQFAFGARALARFNAQYSSNDEAA